MLDEQLDGKPAHPPKQLHEPAPPDELEVPLDQQLGDHLCVSGCGGVLDRLLDEPLRRTPSRRPPSQLAGGIAPELELQNLAEQVVVAIPLAAGVERDQEHIRAREIREHSRRVLAPENRVAQLGREARQHRGAHQKIPGVRRERHQNLVGQIVANLASAARELPHLLVGVLKVAKPERRQIQARGPPLGAIDEQLHAVTGETDPLTHDEVARLIDRESQLPRADLREHPARPQTREADRRIGSGRGDQARIRRQPSDRVGDRTHGRLAADRVQVVEHDAHPTAILDQPVHHLIDRRLDGRTPDPEARQGATPQAATQPLDGRRHMCPQTHRVVVGRVERHPDHGLGTLDTPGPDQRRLAVADRRVQLPRATSPPRHRASPGGEPCAASRDEPSVASASARSPGNQRHPSVPALNSFRVSPTPRNTARTRERDPAPSDHGSPGRSLCAVLATGRSSRPKAPTRRPATRPPDNVTASSVPLVKRDLGREQCRRELNTTAAPRPIQEIRLERDQEGAVRVICTRPSWNASLACKRSNARVLAPVSPVRVYCTGGHHGNLMATSTRLRPARN